MLNDSWILVYIRIEAETCYACANEIKNGVVEHVVISCSRYILLVSKLCYDNCHNQEQID